jgi:hypothetical protein
MRSRASVQNTPPFLTDKATIPTVSKEFSIRASLASLHWEHRLAKS